MYHVFEFLLSNSCSFFYGSDTTQRDPTTHMRMSHTRPKMVRPIPIVLTCRCENKAIFLHTQQQQQPHEHEYKYISAHMQISSGNEIIYMIESNSQITMGSGTTAVKYSGRLQFSSYYMLIHLIHNQKVQNSMI